MGGTGLTLRGGYYKGGWGSGEPPPSYSNIKPTIDKKQLKWVEMGAYPQQRRRTSRIIGNKTTAMLPMAKDGTLVRHSMKTCAQRALFTS